MRNALAELLRILQPCLSTSMEESRSLDNYKYLPGCCVQKNSGDLLNLPNLDRNDLKNVRKVYKAEDCSELLCIRISLGQIEIFASKRAS